MIHSGGFGVFHDHLIEQGGKLIAEVLFGSRAGAGFAGLTGETRSDFQRLADLGHTHLVEVFRIQMLELAFGDVEHGFGQIVLPVAKGLGAGRGIQKDLALRGGFGLHELFGGPGGMRIDAATPVEIHGPAFDGAQARADLTADGRIAAAGAEFQISAECFKGAVGLAPGGSEVEGKDSRRRDDGDIAGGGCGSFFHPRRMN